MTAFPEPHDALSDPTDLFARYLDFYRETVIRKARSLSDEAVGVDTGGEVGE